MGQVSYLLTSYNKASYLPSVLESIRRERAETGGDIVIIDDGSTDGSAQICGDFADTNTDVTLIEHANRGVYAALNRILPLAKAPWVRICNSDDPLIPGSTAYLAEMAGLTGATIAYGAAIDYGPDPLPLEAPIIGRPKAREPYIHPDAILHLIKAMDFNASCAIYRASTANAVLPLPEILISCQDFALALRMTANGTLVRLSDPVSFYLRAAPNQLSASAALTRHQTIRILQASQPYLQRRHRDAAVRVSYQRRRRELRSELTGFAFQIRKIALKALSAAACLGFYDWRRALDAFASPYESQIGALIRRHNKLY